MTHDKFVGCTHTNSLCHCFNYSEHMSFFMEKYPKNEKMTKYG